MNKIYFYIVRAVLLCFLLASSIASYSQINHTERTRLTDDWLFLKGDLGSIWEAVRPANQGSSEEVPLWTNINLPHCFNGEDSVDPDNNFYQGAGWYKTQLSVNNPYSQGRTILHFEGAGQKTEVYIYTQKVGSHVGGYDEWSVDITDAINAFMKSEDAKRFEGKIPLSIRCDNTRDTEMIPSDLSDFNVYGGLYRYINLVYQPSLHFSSLQTYASVDKALKMGTLDIKASFENYEQLSSALVQVKIYDPNGKIIKEENKELKNFGTENILTLDIKNPILWSTDTPNLYTAEVTLESKAGKVVNKEKFGFRHFEFIEKGPFHLNGKRLLLRGTHRHEDHAGVAAAMTEEMIVQEMQMMKEMGVNFIRLGHYQQSRIVLEQCDKLGILVWEEIPWCRGGLGGEVYQAQAKRMLTNMITQHRNHPSVILWGLGNENDWPNDFPEFDKNKIRSFMTELHTLAHNIDNTRLTAIRRCDFCKDIVDVYSPSIWAGWYRGVYTDYKRVSYNEMMQVNHFLHVEWGGDNHARRYAEDAYVGLDRITTGDKADERDGDASLYGGTARASRDGDWSESYLVDLVDWHLKEQETMPWLTGAAYWPFKDFSTPVRPENPVPYMNQKGVVERDFTPKEAFYVFQSYWTEKPMVHIFGANWPTRWGKADEEKQLKVFSNCDQVELFLNGESLGTKKRNSQDYPAAGLRWNTLLKQGTNTVKAIATKGKVTIEDEIQFEYETRSFGDPHQLKATIVSEDSESVWIEAQLRDKNDVLSLNARDYIYFSAVGDGQLIVNQGTSTGSSKVQAYNGRARIQLKKQGGKSVVAIKSEGLKTIFIDIE